MAGVLAIILAAQPMMAAERDVIRADWNLFQEEVAARKLHSRSVRIALEGGGEVKTTVYHVTSAGLTVRLNKSLKQWQKGDNALIPKEQVASARFGGRVKTHGSVGLLAGLGAGAAIAAAYTTNTGCDESGCIALMGAGIALAAAVAVAGCLVGRRIGQPAPEFILAH
jgi:hypothetical protein